MTLVEDWQLILKKAWSIRLLLLSAILSAAEAVVPLFIDVLPHNTFTILAVLAAIGGAASRIIAQPAMQAYAPPKEPTS